LIDDIILEQGDAVLVVESPHKEELKVRHLLAGDSGSGVSKALFDIDPPIGEIIKTLPYKLSLLNTFQHPLKIETSGRSDLLKEVDGVAYPDKSIRNASTIYKNKIKTKLVTNANAPEIFSYKHRVVDALSRTPSKRIVIAGLIAQAVFEYTFSISGKTAYAEPFEHKIEDTSSKIFFICHPSPSDGENGESAWLMQKNRRAIERLRLFLDIPKLVTDKNTPVKVGKG
jgi:hypothetical protein